MSDDLVKRLREEAAMLHGIGIDRGSVDASISGMLADEAAAEITHLRAMVEAADKLAEAAKASRAVVRETMMALIGRGRDELLLADAIHKADDTVRAALATYQQAKEGGE